MHRGITFNAERKEKSCCRTRFGVLRQCGGERRACELEPLSERGQWAAVRWNLVAAACGIFRAGMWRMSIMELRNCAQDYTGRAAYTCSLTCFFSLDRNVETLHLTRGNENIFNLHLTLSYQITLTRSVPGGQSSCWAAAGCHFSVFTPVTCNTNPLYDLKATSMVKVKPWNYISATLVYRLVGIWKRKSLKQLCGFPQGSTFESPFMKQQNSNFTLLMIVFYILQFSSVDSHHLFAVSQCLLFIFHTCNSLHRSNHCPYHSFVVVMITFEQFQIVVVRYHCLLKPLNFV